VIDSDRVASGIFLSTAPVTITTLLLLVKLPTTPSPPLTTPPLEMVRRLPARVTDAEAIVTVPLRTGPGDDGVAGGAWVALADEAVETARHNPLLLTVRLLSELVCLTTSRLGRHESLHR
jgi:hypothetical protein